MEHFAGSCKIRGRLSLHGFCKFLQNLWQVQLPRNLQDPAKMQSLFGGTKAVVQLIADDALLTLSAVRVTVVVQLLLLLHAGSAVRAGGVGRAVNAGNAVSACGDVSAGVAT